MNTAQDIASELTQVQIARALGVGVTAVNNALQRGGLFPAGWYPVVRSLCEERGLECPEGAFNFKVPASAREARCPSA